jgi:hypothetical protein
MFTVKDSPELRRAMDSNTNVTIDSIGPNRSCVDVVSDFKNMGQKKVTIESATVYYWILPTDSIMAAPFFLADSLFSSRRPHYTVRHKSLEGGYTTDHQVSQALTFMLDRDPDHAIVFRTVLKLSRKGFFSREYDSTYSYWYKLRIVP